MPIRRIGLGGGGRESEIVGRGVQGKGRGNIIANFGYRGHRPRSQTVREVRCGRTVHKCRLRWRPMREDLDLGEINIRLHFRDPSFDVQRQVFHYHHHHIPRKSPRDKLNRSARVVTETVVHNLEGGSRGCYQQATC